MNLKYAQPIFVLGLLLASACSQSNSPAPTSLPAQQTANNNPVIDPVSPDGHCTPTFVSEWNNIAEASRNLVLDLQKNKMQSALVLKDLQNTSEGCGVFFANETDVSCLALVHRNPKLVDAKKPVELCHKVLTAVGKNKMRVRGSSSSLSPPLDDAPADALTCDPVWADSFKVNRMEIKHFLELRETVLEQEEDRPGDVDAEIAQKAIEAANSVSEACASLQVKEPEHYSCAWEENQNRQLYTIDKILEQCQLATAFQLDKPVTSPAIANARLRRAITTFPRLYPIELLP